MLTLLCNLGLNIRNSCCMVSKGNAIYLENCPLVEVLSLSQRLQMTDGKLGQCKNRTAELHQGWFLPSISNIIPIIKAALLVRWIRQRMPSLIVIGELLQVISQRQANFNMTAFPLLQTEDIISKLEVDTKKILLNISF